MLCVSRSRKERVFERFNRGGACFGFCAVPRKGGGMSEFTFGVALGQSFDPTAICIVQRVGGRGDDDPVFRVGHLERLPLNTPYPGVIGHVQRLLARFPRETELVLDFTARPPGI